MKKIWEYKSLADFKELNGKEFDNHKIHYKDFGGNDCSLLFKQDDTNEYSLLFTYVGGVLSISGDLGSAVFNWYNPKNHILAHLRFKDIGYIMSKCTARDKEGIKGFDSSLALKELTAIFKEHNIDDEVPYFENSMERDIWAYKNAGDLIEDAFDTGVYTVGDYLDERAFLYWTGFHIALEKLEKELSCQN